MAKKGKQDRSILLVIAFLMLLLIIIFIVLKLVKNAQTVVPDDEIIEANISIEEQNSINQLAEQSELQRIKSMNERTRIEYYVANYIELIEEKDYDKAYRLLNSSYKKNYFSTQNEFEDYCKNTFSSMLDVQYENFERNGDIYVVWLTITDAISGRKDSGIEMNFVIKENSFNDYELSFSKV